ncbi:ankyrin repeat-containing protein BDA1-like [Humulus lupulus]|uniref:ankyrin repeat-containing protein BDA1-like n=1 Tax=Humulus lupulus TaxID=3486 RepID=UPI002B40DE80|nr:ankyrin repeat-containing protein BDA1-like [Humulus lupulus]
MEQNNEGFQPLDIASGLGHVEIVKELLLVWNTTTSSRSEICRLKGRDGRTSIHYAVVHDKIDVMNEVISFSAEFVKDLTDFEETTLHLAVKYYRFEVFKKLVEWLEKLGLEEIVNWVDRDGNTILHLAVSRKQHGIVEFLLNNNNIFSTLKLNERNSKGLTPMELMDLVMENPSDVQLHEILRLAGVVRGRDINTTNTISSSSPPLQHCSDWNHSQEQDQKNIAAMEDKEN